MTYSEILSKRIIQLSTERRWSINLVATIAGLPYSTVNKIVLKERDNPTILTVHSIAKAFDMDIVEFLNIDDVTKLTLEDLAQMRNQAKRK